MGGLAARLSRLEQRARPAMRVRSEAERFSSWQLRERNRRNREIPRSAKVARSRIAWLARVGLLRDFATAEALVEDILEGPDGSGGLQPPEERSRIMVEREVYVSIWRGDPDLQEMSVPAEWVQILDAAEQWRERLESVPPAACARWLVETRRVMQDGYEAGQIEEVADRHLGPFNIGEPLLERVVGRGVLDLTSEEVSWLLDASLQDLFCSRWSFEVGEAVRKIDETGGE